MMRHGCRNWRRRVWKDCKYCVCTSFVLIRCYMESHKYLFVPFCNLLVIIIIIIYCVCHSAAMTSDNIDDIIKPKQKLRIPIVSGLIEYSQSIFVPPDEAWRKRQIIIWGVSTLVCLIVPTLTEGFARVNWLPAGGMMGYRGMPGMGEGAEGGFNPYRGKRNKKHQLQAMAIAVFAWVMARSVAETVVSKVPAMAASRSAEWFRFAIVQVSLGTLVSFIQTYKEGEDNPELMI